MIGLKIRMVNSHFVFLLSTIVFLGCTISKKEKTSEKENSNSVKFTTTKHDDIGPENRYGIPYEPITYGQDILAPLPGLAYDYKMVDWDNDGLIDILANVRRGAGIVLYKNIGNKKDALYRTLQENEQIMKRDSLGRYFGIIDLDKDGKNELIGYNGQTAVDKSSDSQCKLNLYRNQGENGTYHWLKIPVLHPNGEQVTAPKDVRNAPRIEVSDWDNDGKEDLIIGYESTIETLASETDQTKAMRMSGFRDPKTYNPNTGKVFFLRNMTINSDKPIFANAELILADGNPIRTYIHPYPTVFDQDGDGLKDLLVGSHKAEIRVFKNVGTPNAPRLTDVGFLKNEKGEKIKTFLAIRAYPADIDGDGIDELIASSYYGNQDRYVVYKNRGQGWKNMGYLKINATVNTPVYGMGNSTIDPVDWDNDGDTDLLLGAEGSFPTIIKNIGTEKNRVFEPAQRLQYMDGSPLETFSIEEGVGSYWGPMEWYSDRIAPRAVDWDGDGVFDIITGSMGRRIYFLKGEKVNGELRFHRPKNFRLNKEVLPVPDRILPGITDWNDDGKPDLLLSAFNGNVLVYQGNQTLDLESPITLKHSNGNALVLQDFWERKKGNRSGFTVSDWDNDGDTDLIIFQFHRGVFLFRNNGNNTFGYEEVLVPLYSHLAGASVMDWDNDGYLDLLVGGDERRMIEPSTPAHLVVFHGQDVKVPPKKRIKK